MICNIPIKIEFKGRSCVLIVTELDHTPEQVKTFNCEYLPENFEVVRSYVIDEDGRDVDAYPYVAYLENEKKVNEALRKFWYRGDTE